MSVPKIVFRKEPGGPTYSGYFRSYAGAPPDLQEKYPYLRGWEGKTTGVDVENRILRVSDAGKNYCEVPFDMVVRVNTEACCEGLLGYDLSKLIPHAKVYGEGYGADLKLEAYLEAQRKPT